MYKRNNWFDYINIIFMIFLGLITLYPFIYVFSVSISDPFAVRLDKVNFLPIGFSLASYKKVLSDSRVIIGYYNTIRYLVVGTASNIIATTLFSYPLSRKTLTWKRPILLAVTFAMLFSGGMIPYYVLIGKLKMIDTIFAMFLPGLVWSWNVLIMKTFFEGIPDSISESAYLDGATEIQSFYYIFLPLSVPIILVIMMYHMVDHWNKYFDAYIYLKTPKKFPLQIVVNQIIRSGSITDERSAFRNDDLPVQSITAAIIMVAALPIAMVYPFIQKYFIKGVMIGSLKG